MKNIQWRFLSAMSVLLLFIFLAEPLFAEDVVIYGPRQILSRSLPTLEEEPVQIAWPDRFFTEIRPVAKAGGNQKPYETYKWTILTKGSPREIGKINPKTGQYTPPVSISGDVQIKIKATSASFPSVTGEYQFTLKSKKALNVESLVHVKSGRSPIFFIRKREMVGDKLRVTKLPANWRIVKGKGSIDKTGMYKAPKLTSSGKQNVTIEAIPKDKSEPQEPLQYSFVVYEDSKPKYKYLTGYNVRWPDLPRLDAKFFMRVNDLKPQLIRYPGGTLAHRNWYWRKGKGGPPDYKINKTEVPDNPLKAPHYITELKSIIDGTSAEIIFVLDIVYSSYEDQEEMLLQAQKQGASIKYVELGNEIYAKHYVDIFTTGRDYAERASKWIPRLRKKFPKVKLSVSMLARDAGAERMKNWNKDVLGGLISYRTPVDALVYHVYTRVAKKDKGTKNQTAADRYQEFLRNLIGEDNHEIWITEFGARSQTIKVEKELTELLSKEGNILMPHTLYSGSGKFSMLTPDYEYTEFGDYFLKRNNPELE